jgi:hypothetical protein
LGNQGINVKRHATNNQNFILGTLKSIRAAPKMKTTWKVSNVTLAIVNLMIWPRGADNFGNVELAILAMWS